MRIPLTILCWLFFYSKSYAQNPTCVPAFDFLIQFNNCRDFALSSNNDEVYFTLQNANEEVSRIAYSKKRKGQWTKPQLVSFTSNHRDIEPFLAHNDLRLYFASNRPLQDSLSKSKDYDIWYVERKSVKESWSKPINLGFPINSTKDEFYPSVALNGNLYFTSENENSLGKDDIFVCRYENNTYTQPENLGAAINSTGYEFNAFIAPDESFILFTAYKREEGSGSGDLYISYKDKQGNWQTATNLGTKINSSAMDYCPFYDTRSSTLYFTSKRSLVTNKPFKSIDEFEQEINQYENGFSRIYKCNLKL